MKHIFNLLLIITSVICTSISHPLISQIETLNVRPLADEDDAEEDIEDGGITLNSSDLELGGYDASAQIVGIRFPNVTLPAGSTIVNAYIQFTVDETDDLATSITIKAQQGNALVYTDTDGDITNRTYTGSSVTWNPQAWNSSGDRGVDQRTPDLTGIISEAIQGGFTPGGALAFTFSASQELGDRTAESFDSDPDSAAELVIEYTEQPIVRTLLTDILVINEVTGAGTPENNADWVELYNTSNNALNLDSVSITDNIDNPSKFMFSQRNINGQAYVLVETEDYFGIKEEGETIFLFQTFNGTTVLLDSLSARSTINNTSYGRKPDGSTNIIDFGVSTPGSSNNAAEEFIDLQFSRQRGLYKSGFSLSLNASGATIRYTTDSTIPTRTDGNIYNGPISINSNTVVKAFAYNNEGESKTITSTYIISSDRAYEELPIVNISTTSSISTTSENEGTFEFINKYGENKSAFNDAGYKVFGNVSKNERKKNFRVLFKEEYGDKKFRHDVFEEEPGTGIKPASVFKALDLKSGHDATGSYGLGGTMMSEVTARKYMRKLGSPEIHARYTHLFFNGEYHGVYALRERFNHHWMEEYYGGEDEEYDALNSGDTVSSFPDSPSAQSGTKDSWDFLKSVAETDFQALKTGLNIKQFIDYMLFYFSGDYESEWRANTDRDFERAKMQLYHNDLDGFIRANADSGLGGFKAKLDVDSGHGPGKLFYLANMGGFNLEYVTAVKDRTLVVFDDDPNVGILSASAMAKTTREVRNKFRTVNRLEYDRWGYSNSSEFESRLNSYISYLPERVQRVKAFLNERDLLHTHDYVNFSRQEGNLFTGQTVTISNPNSGTTVYYTLDGRDVVFDNGIAPWAIAYTPGQALPLEDGVNTVKARAYSNNNFGPLSEGTFNLVTGINITGVGYNIQDNDNLDFLFVSNFSNQTVQVAGDSITAAISFAFPAGASIGAGETVMLTKDLSKYPDISFQKFLWEDGKLSNGGEQIVYKSVSGDTINNFTYNDKLPWPEEADGNGAYLKLKTSDLDNTNPLNWEAAGMTSLGRINLVDPVDFQNYGINIIGVGYNIKNAEGEGDDNLEFLFITNFGTQDRLVAGDSIYQGIDFAFPAGTVIPVGDTVMITKDIYKYPDITYPKFSWSDGKLSNSGEQVAYKNLAGDIINDFTYLDTIPWPAEADGNGSYLKLIANNLDNSVAANWEAEDISSLGRIDAVDPQVYLNYGINITGVGYNIKDDTGAGDDNLEFLFVTNFGTQDRVVAGDSINQGITFAFPAGTTISAGETVMLSKDLTKYPDLTLRKFSWSEGKLSNGGERIMYKNFAEDIINDFTYLDTIPWPVAADGNGSYLQLIASDLDNRIPSNWRAADITSLGRTSAVDPQVFEDYGINITGVGYNIVDDTGIDNDSLEFLFVTNFGTEDRVVAGDSIYQGITFAFPPGAMIPPGETVMITKDLSKYPDVTMTKFLWVDGKLSNSGERIAYKNAAGDIINEFTYSDDLPWPLEADGLGFYLQLNADDLDNRLAEHWQAVPVSDLGQLSCADTDDDGVCDDDDQCPGLDDSLTGTPCDDGDICTIGEAYDANCACTGGVSEDSDNDGVCDVEDQCPSLDDNLIGTPCDDGDECTVGESYDANCTCSGGTFLDVNNDGICDSLNGCDLVDFEDFEQDAGIWQTTPNALDAFRLSTPDSPSGNYSFLIRDNSGLASSVFTSPLDLSGAESAEITFKFKSRSLSVGEDFFLEMSTDGGTSFQVIKQWINGTDFDNDMIYNELINISSPELTNMVIFRFRCDGGINSDQVFLDDIKIDYCPLEPECEQTIVQSGNESIRQSQSAVLNIVSDGIVMTGSDVEFTAGNEIELIENFEVQVGALFHAFIDSCQN